MLDLAIVIVNYNVRDLLYQCLQSVYASEGNVAYEVCVVDNASADNSCSMVSDDYPQASLIELDDNIGYPAANNVGLNHFGDWSSETPPARYALLLNPDTELKPDTLYQMIRYMDGQPDVGVAGPKLVLPNGQIDPACRRSFPTPEIIFYRVAQLSRIFPNSRRFARYNLTFLDEDQEAEVDSVVGAFMMVRAMAIARVGLLDERFFMYAEDLDWAKRIKEDGWRVMYNPYVVVKHVKRASSRQMPKRMRLEFERANLRFYRKHYQSNTPFLVNAAILAAIALRGGRALWSEIWNSSMKQAETV
ncbi:MAG: glycosyltransferase family 2 protein [Chloroflexota bacterium]